jgi:hypothetical protein
LFLAARQGRERRGSALQISFHFSLHPIQLQFHQRINTVRFLFLLCPSGFVFVCVCVFPLPRSVQFVVYIRTSQNGYYVCYNFIRAWSSPPLTSTHFFTVHHRLSSLLHACFSANSMFPFPFILVWSLLFFRCLVALQPSSTCRFRASGTNCRDRQTHTDILG